MQHIDFDQISPYRGGGFVICEAGRVEEAERAESESDLKQLSAKRLDFCAV